MSRLIDADKLTEAIKNELWDWETVDGITATTVLKQTISDIGNAPTVDAVEVVRCKECIHYDLRWGKCNHADLQESMRFRPHRDKDDFCKRGERKTE